ncbi:aminotransferase class IV [Asaia prunellae]|uniref:aminotransferase class IV n=1 Tax=Asaia prunellae TaxID=610245 RepID=UPI00046FA08D|nr:aminotransferase class IV [Asaia prunellae]
MIHAWLNDRLIAAGSACIKSTDRGFLLGDGVFETMRLQRGKIIRLEAHLARLADGAALLQIPQPSDESLSTSLEMLIEANNQNSGSLRLTLSRGAGPRGLLPPAAPSPTLLITQSAPVPPPGPCRLHVSRYRRDGASPLSHIKHLNYLPQILSRIEAHKAGYDDSLLLSAHGDYIAEASASSLIMLSKGQLLTPPLEDGALAGTARAALIKAGLCREAHLSLAALCRADAAWLINSLSMREVHAVEEISLPRHDIWSRDLDHALFE